MSRGVRTVIGIVAAIAIPFAAPALAGAIGLSGAIGGALGTSAAMSSAIGSSLVGAGLGAANAAVTGGDVGRGAILGGIGGGIGGYAYTPSPQVTLGAAGGTGEVASAGLNLAPGAPIAEGGSAAAQAAAQTGVNPAFSTGGVPTADFGAANAGMTVPESTASAFGGTPVPTGPAMTGGVPSMDFAAANASPAIGGSPNAPAVAAPGTPQTFQQALGARFTPQAMADMTLRAGAMLAGSAAAGSGLSPEQQALLTQQTEDLRALRDTNRAAYEQRMQGARQLMQQAGYYNPEYMGQQFAASAMNRQAAQTAANVRGLPEAQRAAEERRGRIETGRAMGTAYQQGFGAGVQGQTQTIQAGLQSIPSSFPSLAQEYAGIGNVYNTAANRQRTMQADIGTLFGSVTGPQQAASRNMTDEERRRTT